MPIIVNNTITFNQSSLSPGPNSSTATVTKTVTVPAGSILLSCAGVSFGFYSSSTTAGTWGGSSVSGSISGTTLTINVTNNAGNGGYKSVSVGATNVRYVYYYYE